MSSSGHGSSQAPLASLAENVQKELGSLAQDCDEMQGLISGLLMSSVITDDTMVALQSLDHITQRLAGVAEFLGQLTPQMDTGWVVDQEAARSRVLLSDLAARLACTRASAA